MARFPRTPAGRQGTGSNGLGHPAKAGIQWFVGWYGFPLPSTSSGQVRGNDN